MESSTTNRFSSVLWFLFLFLTRGRRLQRFGLALRAGVGTQIPWAVRNFSSPARLKWFGRICLKKELSHPSALAFALLTVAGVCFEAY